MILKHEIAKHLRNGLAGVLDGATPPAPYVPKDRILPWSHSGSIQKKPYVLFYLGPWRSDNSWTNMPIPYNETIEPGPTIHLGIAVPRVSAIGSSPYYLYDPNTDFEALELYPPVFIETNNHVANALKLVDKHTIFLTKPIGPMHNPQEYVIKDPVMKRIFRRSGTMRLQTTVVDSNESSADIIADAFHMWISSPLGLNRVFREFGIGAYVIDPGEILVNDFIEPRSGRDETWARRRDIISMLSVSDSVVEIVPLIRSLKLIVEAGSQPKGMPCYPMEQTIIVTASASP